MDSYLALISRLVDEGVLRTPRIIKAFEKIHRKHFLPHSSRGQEGIDAPLPIGYGQTISQPYTVAFMLELLQPQKGQKIMDIGYGSGWTSALLAHIVGAKGHVFAIEIVPALFAFGKANIAKFNFIKKGRVSVFCRDGSKGLFKFAPFDRIIAAAFAKELPEAWASQLAEDGRLVVPLKESIWLMKKQKGEIGKKEYPGFLFVPLVHS